jgi:hypothetical protein
VTVTAPPGVILSTPDTFPITPGADGKLKVSVRRFGSAKTSEVLIRAKQLPPALTIAPLKIPATAKDIQLVVSATPQAVSSPITLEAVSPSDGRLLGESAPFLVDVKSEAKDAK